MRETLPIGRYISPASITAPPGEPLRIVAIPSLARDEIRSCQTAACSAGNATSAREREKERERHEFARGQSAAGRVSASSKTALLDVPA